jgi:uncharacterized protein YegL
MKEVKELKSKRKTEDDGISLILEYVMIAGVCIVFVSVILTYTNTLFIDKPTKSTLSNQMMDVGNQISNKIVDVALIAPQNGEVKVKLFMPYTVGDNDFKAGFVQMGGRYILELKSEKLNRTEHIPLSNIVLQVIPEGSTYSLSINHEFTYSSTSHITPTAVALAYPSTLTAGGNTTFDMTYSTGEGQLWFTWEFGDGDTYTGSFTPGNPDGALVEHRYSSPGNYTAKLTVWDSLGYTDTDSINITVLSSTPDPFIYIDKILNPEVVEPYEDVKVTIYIRGGGIVQEPRNVSVMHVIDCSGSMDPDKYSDGYTFYELITSGSVSPSKWNGNVTVDGWQSMIVDAYSTGEDVDLWVKSPDGDFARAQYWILNGERYYVSSPISGIWEIAVVADYPTATDSITVQIWKKDGEWSIYATYNFLLSGNAFPIPLTVPSVENLKIDVDAVNGSKTLHLWVDDGSLHGPYSDSSGYTESNAGGSYTAYVVADFPYGSQEFELKTYIAKIDAAKIAAKTFNSYLKNYDTVGVAYFNGTGSYGSIRQAEVVQTLTSNTDLANSSIDGLTAYGGTPMGDGIYVAQEELVANAPASSTPVLVLLSDGNPTLPQPDSDAIQLALNNATNAKSTIVNGENILIYTIGFGSDANETLLEQVATSPDYYYHAASASELEDIYEQIAKDLKEKAATNITITDVLPENVQLSSIPSGANITYNDENTIIQWNISAIRINETWTVSFYVKPEVEGRVNTNIFGLSNVTYLPYPFTNVSVSTVNFPWAEVNVENIADARVSLS